MKNIELTEDHKSKLLKMCKILFSEYEISVNQVGEGFINHVIFYEAHDQMYKIVQHYPPGKPFPKRLFKFHWFEFCMTHLSDKIFNEIEKLKGKGNVNSKKYIGTMYCPKGAYLGLLYSKIHPVDYLYEEFKKLKL